MIGAANVGLTLVVVRTLGAGGLVAAIVGGLLLVTALIDRFGLLGLERHSLTPIRLAGFALLLAGTLMVLRR